MALAIQNELAAPADEFHGHTVEHGFQSVVALGAGLVGERMSENLALAGDKRVAARQTSAPARLAVVDLVDVGEPARCAPSEHDLGRANHLGRALDKMT